MEFFPSPPCSVIFNTTFCKDLSVRFCASASSKNSLEHSFAKKLCVDYFALAFCGTSGPSFFQFAFIGSFFCAPNNRDISVRSFAAFSRDMTQKLFVIYVASAFFWALFLNIVFLSLHPIDSLRWIPSFTILHGLFPRAISLAIFYVVYKVYLCAVFRWDFWRILTFFLRCSGEVSPLVTSHGFSRAPVLFVCFP